MILILALILGSCSIRDDLPRSVARKGLGRTGILFRSLKERQTGTTAPSASNNTTSTGDGCHPSPCQNGGSCFVHFMNGAICMCDVGWRGPTCDLESSACIQDPCQNGGMCSAGVDDVPVCSCPEQYYGEFCEEHYSENPCDPNPCANWGVCSTDSMTNTAICNCPQGWVGNFCETRSDPCDFNPCLNGGVCTSEGSVLDLPNSTQHRVDVKCSCAPGWAGSTCSIRSPCSPNPCLNDGICTGSIHDTPQCHCIGGYKGDFCSSLDDPCDFNPCQNEGSCVTNGHDIHCLCPKGWIGHICSIESHETVSTSLEIISTLPMSTSITDAMLSTTHMSTFPISTSPTDLCDSLFCENGGTCTSEGSNKARCICSEGFTGQTCEIYDITTTTPTSTDPCDSLVCNNGAQCISEGSDQAWCICPEGWTGPHCQFMIPTTTSATTAPMPAGPCDFLTCRNGGRCISEGSNQASCICLQGWTGRTCEFADAQITTNVCEPNPCTNGGWCIARGSGTAFCACSQGFRGLRCEKESSACIRNPCHNGGTCVPSKEDNPTCHCPSGFIGDYCSFPVAPSPIGYSGSTTYQSTYQMNGRFHVGPLTAASSRLTAIFANDVGVSPEEVTLSATNYKLVFTVDDVRDYSSTLNSPSFQSKVQSSFMSNAEVAEMLGLGPWGDHAHCSQMKTQADCFGLAFDEGEMKHGEARGKLKHGKKVLACSWKRGYCTATLMPSETAMAWNPNSGGMGPGIEMEDFCPTLTATTCVPPCMLIGGICREIDLANTRVEESSVRHKFWSHACLVFVLALLIGASIGYLIYAWFHKHRRQLKNENLFIRLRDKV